MVLYKFYFCANRIKMYFFSGVLALAVVVGALYGFTDVFPADELARVTKQQESSHRKR